MLLFVGFVFLLDCVERSRVDETFEAIRQDAEAVDATSKLLLVDVVIVRSVTGFRWSARMFLDRTMGLTRNRRARIHRVR
jgi:hypothetical protein